MTPAVERLIDWISEEGRAQELGIHDHNSIDDYGPEAIRFDCEAGRMGATLENDDVVLFDLTHELRAEELIHTPTHALAADILAVMFGPSFIFERTSTRGGIWHQRSGAVWEQVHNLRVIMREVLEQAISEAHERLDMQATEGKARAAIFKATGRAIQRVQAVEFLTRTEELLREHLGVDPIAWNSTPDTLPCTDSLVDFSGPTMLARDPEPLEFWRDPVPFTADEILNAPHPAKYEIFLFQIFPDLNTNLTARYTRAAAIRGTGAKTIVIGWNSLGNGAKNTDTDVTAMAAGPGLMAFPSGALVTRKGDSGEKRFDTIRLRGSRFAVFDEVTGVFDVAALKRFTSLSEIRGEAKGQDAITFPQTWVIFILTNELPAFYPPDDSAFLNRLIVLPYQSVFYESEEQKEQLLERGADPDHLLPARDKREIISELEPERAGILRLMIEDAITLRDSYRGKVPESEVCKRAKEQYRSTNDRVQAFIDEMLRLDPGGRIANSRLLELYQEFSGDRRMDPRTLVRRMKKIVPGIESCSMANGRGQIGIVEVLDV